MYTVTQPESFKSSAIHNFVWRTNSAVICRIVFIYKTTVGVEVSRLNLSKSFKAWCFDTKANHLNVPIWVFFLLVYIMKRAKQSTALQAINTDCGNTFIMHQRWLLHHTSGRQAGRLREQVSCTAVGARARLRTWWRTMCWWMWRDTFSASSQLWNHVISIFYLLKTGHFGSRSTWVLGVVGYAFLSTENRIRKRD